MTWMVSEFHSLESCAGLQHLLWKGCVFLLFFFVEILLLTITHLQSTLSALVMTAELLRSPSNSEVQERCSIDKCGFVHDNGRLKDERGTSTSV